MQSGSPEQWIGPLKPITSNHFTITTLSKKISVKEFCKENQLLSNEELRCSVFVECDNLGDEEQILKNMVDVVLKEKVRTKFHFDTS